VEREPAKADAPVASATPGDRNSKPAPSGAVPASPGAPGAPAAALSPSKPPASKKPQPAQSSPLGNFFGFGNNPPPQRQAPAPPRQLTPGAPRPPAPVGRSAAIQ
jgi:hypothetical protein